MAAFINALAQKRFREALSAYVSLERDFLHSILIEYAKRYGFSDLGDTEEPQLLATLIVRLLLDLAYGAQHPKQPHLQITPADLCSQITNDHTLVLPAKAKTVIDRALKLGIEREQQPYYQHNNQSHWIFESVYAKINAHGVYNNDAIWLQSLKLIALLYRRIASRDITIPPPISPVEGMETDRNASVVKFEEELDSVIDLIHVYRTILNVPVDFTDGFRGELGHLNGILQQRQRK
jgi:hypothetical protein